MSKRFKFTKWGMVEDPDGDWCEAPPVGVSPQPVQRFDLVSVNFAYTSDHEMERADDGEWVRFDDVRYLLAQVRERDAQIARLSAQVEGYLSGKGVASCGHYAVFTLQCVYEDGTEAPCCMQCDRDAAQDKLSTAEAAVDTLRAERDAAQQQIARLRAENASFTAAATVRVESAEAKIATLTSALDGLVTKLDVILPKVDSIIAFQTVRSGHQAYNGPNLIEELAAARAALQSTRPQEQL